MASMMIPSSMRSLGGPRGTPKVAPGQQQPMPVIASGPSAADAETNRISRERAADLDAWGRSKSDIAAQAGQSWQPAAANFGAVEDPVAASNRRQLDEFTRQQADVAASRERTANQDALLAKIPSMMALMGNVPTIQPTGPAAPLPGTPSASDLAFARAKDKVGLISKSKIQAAQSSGNPRAISSIIEGAGDDLSNFATEQALSEADRASRLEDRNFQAAINQRGQNMSMLPSLLALLKAY